MNFIYDKYWGFGVAKKMIGKGLLVMDNEIRLSIRGC